VPLVTTACAGENGSWFRNPLPGHNFWSGFYQELLRRVQAGESALRPVFIEDYLAQHGAQGVVNVGPGAWNTGWHNGTDFMQWTGSQAQQDALTRLGEVSQAVHAASTDAMAMDTYNPALHQQLEEAHWRVLRAETSCNFFWNDAWVNRCHRDLDEACACLERASFR
jgi:alpha-amylase/alpha-mannosidase (GH57 family)